MRRVEGTILTVRCTACAATAAIFQFAGDSDVATEGLASACADGGHEIVIGEMTSLEWLDQSAGQERFARRISDELQSDFRAVRWLRMEGGVTPRSVSFQEFRRRYVASTPVYACSRCDGESRLIMEQSGEEFIAHGGSIHIRGDLYIGNATDR